MTTRARLHFGFFDPSGQGAQPFGSFGLGLDRPVTALTLSRADALTVSGPESERAGSYLTKLAEMAGRDGNYSLDIASAIPSHSGLGSGTQLALAVGAAFARIEGLALSPREIASTLDRGRRSGIGIGTFARGGAVIDEGPRGGDLPVVLARADFPEEWRVLLIFDPDCKGLHGSGELEAFATAPAFPDAESARLKQRSLHSALPALTEGYFDRFCEIIGHLQSVMGLYFAPYQGGPLVSENVSAAVHWLRGEGYRGVGQSSWGPTGFAILPSEQESDRLLADAAKRDEFSGLRFELARGCNEGALIECR
ncbi:GHMP family kinase ATP-binding protein [Methyloligella solikamskensis]|uniref:GHMP kinase n=1 Tax=Methyloligella solikamskensis TaxID=1177756 RepID=A0ABW3JB83_9HYPH